MEVKQAVPKRKQAENVRPLASYNELFRQIAESKYSENVLIVSEQIRNITSVKQLQELYDGALLAESHCQSCTDVNCTPC